MAQLNEHMAFPSGARHLDGVIDLESMRWRYAQRAKMDAANVLRCMLP
jgi:hypothetical protein